MKRYYGGKILSFWVVMLTLCLITLSFTSAANAANVKLGLITDLTGGAFVSARDSADGAGLAVDRINAEGGILGNKVELLVRDSALKTDLGVSHARELILDKKVKLIVGPISSSVRLAISDLCRRYKVPLIDGIGGSVSLNREKGHDYFWQSANHTDGESYAAAVGCSIFKEVKTMITIAPDYVWGRQEVEGFTRAFTGMRPDVKIVENFWPKLGEKDYTPYITAMLAKNPDLLYSVLYGGDWINFVKQAKPYGLFKKMKVLCFAEASCQQGLGKEAPEGTWGFGRAPAPSIRTPEMKSFMKAYKEMIGRWPSDTSVTTYDAFMIFKYGAEKAKSIDGPAWIKAMKGATVEILRGTLTFRECDNMGNSVEYIGPLVYDPEYGYVVFKPALAIDITPARLSCEEIMQLRKKAK
ncbi:MAG: ABC transporter substrate-binding protein [Desulfobacteraceae bacterium]|nr:ABC transporter substrate-binding protein [Desulfobacteraceae bacterium]